MPTPDERPLPDVVRALVCQVARMTGMTPAAVCVAQGLPLMYATHDDARGHE